MALKRKNYLKKRRTFALSQARRSIRIRCLKRAQSARAARHALFFIKQQEA